MRCGQCGRENLAKARFCMACGARLGLVCPQCAAELPPDPDLRFCTSCGARLEGEQPGQRLSALAEADQVAEDRRPVTLIFADLAGWTQIASNLDPEDLQQVQRSYFTAVTAPIEAHGGSVEKYIGDAVLAVFGTPQAHEDDPELAIRAALAMQEAIIALNDHLATPPRLVSDPLISGPLTLSLRIGVHTGLVVSRVDKDGDFVVTGDAVNLASRLQNAAEPGTVLVSAETAKLAAHAFEIVDLGAIQIKGKAEPVQVFRVVSPRATPAKLRGVAGLESPLVGRQAEMEALRHVVDRLQHGIGGIITIAGEAGIGKSRLVAELCKQMPYGPGEASSPVEPRWVEGRCLSYGSSIAYLPWLGILRTLMGVSADEAPAAVAGALRSFVHSVCADRFDDVYPYLVQMMSLPLEDEYKQALVRLAGQELRQHTFMAVTTIITCMAEQQPLVMVLEDLHWSDATSLALLELLLASIVSAPLLIIAVFRPDKEHGSWRLRHIAAEQHTDLLLDPLTSSDCQRLVDNLLRAGALPEELSRCILARAEGNPFYVEEIIRALLDEGVLVPDPEAGGWRVTRDVEEIAIPDTLQGVLLARIDRLPRDTKRVLQMASVIGRNFLYRLLQAIGKQERGLDNHLLRLQLEEMVRERTRLPELEYIFKHELTREAAYNGILKRKRLLFHRQIAEAIERLFPDRVEEQLGLLAYHWELAGDAEKAVGYLLRAAQRDVRQFANQEAITHFTRGLVLLKAMPHTPERVQLEFALQMGLGTPLIATSGYGAPEVGRAWGRALELSRQMGDPPQLWPAQSAIFQYYIMRAEHQTALEIAQQMADAGERAGEALVFPFPRGALGISCFYLGDFEPARLHLEAMVARYDREKHHTSAFVYGQDVGVLYLSYLAWVLWFLGYVDQARERSQEAVGLAKALDHPFTLALALNLAGRLYSSCWDYSTTLALAEAAAGVAHERGFVFFQAAALGLQGWAHVAQGDLEQGEAEIQRSLATWEATGTKSHRSHFLTWLAEAARKMGRIDEGLALLTEALALVEKTDERYYEAEIRRLKAEFMQWQGHLSEAEAGFWEAIEVARQQGAKSLQLRATVSLSRLWQSQGRHEDARQPLVEIYEWFTEGFDTPDLMDARSLLDDLLKK
jgi:class 3 adenylate cyclase/predicted ATPase